MTPPWSKPRAGRPARLRNARTRRLVWRPSETPQHECAAIALQSGAVSGGYQRHDHQAASPPTTVFETAPFTVAAPSDSSDSYPDRLLQQGAVDQGPPVADLAGYSRRYPNAVLALRTIRGTLGPLWCPPRPAGGGNPHCDEAAEGGIEPPPPGPKPHTCSGAEVRLRAVMRVDGLCGSLTVAQFGARFGARG
jgi:hypothetical protein